MNPKHRALTIVQTLDGYLKARYEYQQRIAPIEQVEGARGFLLVALEMMLEEIQQERPIINHPGGMHD